ncbi:MAG: hypothetical protein U0527_14815 [Candidatus Eisenbacteria bacterium]
MSALDRLEQILDGDLVGLRARTAAGADAAATLAGAAGVSLDGLSDDGIMELLDRFSRHGHRLRALSLLKVLAASDPSGTRLRPLLASLMEKDMNSTVQPDFSDPELAEFLGTEKPEAAWAAISADRLELVTAEFPDDSFGQDAFVICRDARSEPPIAPFGTALVWRIQHLTEDSSRGRRSATRRRVSFQVGVTLLSGTAENRVHQKLMRGSSICPPLGMGIVLDDPYGQLGPHTKKGARLKLALPCPRNAAATPAWPKSRGTRTTREAIGRKFDLGSAT